MPKVSADLFSQLAAGIDQELRSDAPKIYARLFPDTPPGMVNMPETKYIELVKRSWDDVQFRKDLLARVGPDQFRETIRRAFGTQAWPNRIPDSQLPAYQQPGDMPPPVPPPSAAMFGSPSANLPVPPDVLNAPPPPPLMQPAPMAAPAGPQPGPVAQPPPEVI